MHATENGEQILRSSTRPASPEEAAEMRVVMQAGETVNLGPIGASQGPWYAEQGDRPLTPREKVELIEHEILYEDFTPQCMTNDGNQPRWTDEARKEFLAIFRLQMEQKDSAESARILEIWEIKESELRDDWLGWRLRLCPAPDCAFRLLIVDQKAQAQKLHPGCVISQRREQWKVSKRAQRDK